MKKILSIFVLLFIIITLTACNKENSIGQNNNEVNGQTEQIMEKLEIYYFHRTARCYSCKTIGQYVKEVMEEKYEEQIKNGIIDFRELNIELPENKGIAIKYQTSGSSLFINKIIDGKNNIEQDTNVWRLLSNEVQFKDYLENKINSFLGI